MRFIFTCILVGMVAIGMAQVPAGFVQRQVAQNLNPTALSFSPDGRLFVVEKDGNIREEVNDVLAPNPFITIPNVDNTNERGLSGLCFHPNFPKTPYFYVYYAVLGQNHNRVSRFQVTNGVADPKSEKVIIDLDVLQGTVHNAGAMRFGLDGKLYVAVGDGSNPSAAQSLTSLLGKILRLNDDGSIPADNPLVSQTTNTYKAIYALGFRNPFSLDVDRASGRLLAGDVGGDKFEEINDVKAGYNYGWPLIEGPRTNEDAPANYADPLYAYDHDAGCAITGLATYNPPTVRFPSDYVGKIVYADYCGGYINGVDPVTKQLSGTFVTGIDRPVGIAVSPDGYLYYLARAGLGGGSQQDNTSTWNGSLYKVVYYDSGLPYISSQSGNAFVPVGESVTFSVEAVGAKPLTYSWYRNGKAITGANQAQYVLGNPTLSDNGATFVCIVSNTLGADTSASMSLRVVQAKRPVAHISQPATNATYRAGDVLQFSGEALDGNQQPLVGATLTWWIEFHHEDHTHPALDPVTGPTSGTYAIPRVGETSTNVWYQVHLRVTDVSGLTSEAYVDVKPEIATVSISSSLTGVQFSLDGEPLQPPYSFDSVVGMLRQLSTKPYVAAPEGFYKFQGWGSGLSNTSVSYQVPTGTTTLTMAYQALAVPKGNGLLGQYYTNSDQITGTPTLTRVDETINFDWAEGSPDPQISQDNFVVRWTGKLLAPFSDTLTFYTQTDDGVRLWVNNTLLIDHWGPQASTEWSGSMAVVAGQQYTIQMDYLEAQGYANARLYWGASAFDKAIISKPYLFSAQVVTATTPEADASLLVFPIPAHDQLTVRYSALKPGDAQLEVVDMLGRSIHTQPIRFVAGTNTYSIGVTNWPAGLYTLALRPTGQPVVYRRLLVR